MSVFDLFLHEINDYSKGEEGYGWTPGQLKNNYLAVNGFFSYLLDDLGK